MNRSIKEQLADLFNIRNEMVHNSGSTTNRFSSYFLQYVEQYDLDLEELSALLDRGMRPGKALRRLMESRIKENAKIWADREGKVGKERESYIQGFLQANLGGPQFDEDVKELCEALTAEDHVNDVYFAETPEYIADVYRNGPASCMVDPFASQMAGLAYGSCEALAVAYCRDSRDRISARTLVNVYKREFGRVYGDESSKLRRILEVLGYYWKDEDQGSPADGERLFVPLVREMWKEEWCNQTYYEKEVCYWHCGELKWTTTRSYFLVSGVKTNVRQSYRPPYVDWTDALVATEECTWLYAFGKKWLGRWMRPLKYWDSNQTLYDNDGKEIELNADEITEVWSFEAHARAATLLEEPTQYFKSVWNRDPLLKWADWC